MPITSLMEAASFSADGTTINLFTRTASANCDRTVFLDSPIDAVVVSVQENSQCSIVLLFFTLGLANFQV